MLLAFSNHELQLNNQTSQFLNVICITCFFIKWRSCCWSPFKKFPTWFSINSSSVGIDSLRLGFNQSPSVFTYIYLWDSRTYSSGVTGLTFACRWRWTKYSKIVSAGTTITQDVLTGGTCTQQARGSWWECWCDGHCNLQRGRACSGTTSQRYRPSSLDNAANPWRTSSSPSLFLRKKQKRTTASGSYSKSRRSPFNLMRERTDPSLPWMPSRVFWTANNKLDSLLKRIVLTSMPGLWPWLKCNTTTSSKSSFCACYYGQCHEQWHHICSGWQGGCWNPWWHFS